jgi:feruloyl esterase
MSRAAATTADEEQKMRIARLVGVVFLGVACARPAAAASCDALTAVVLPHTAVTVAQVVAAGNFVPPGPARAGGPAKVFATLPSFCRVAATLTPSADSDIKIEVWLPASGWNGKFQAIGNGGWNGSIPYPSMAEALADGYATAGTDTGHAGNSAAFALGHPEKIIDFGYRAVHEMTAQAKAIVKAFYGSASTFSVWNGCSQGGRQGIAAAVRYPGDFDAVIAGAPAVNFMQLHAGRMALNRSVNATPAHTIPTAAYPLIHKAVLAACDAKDGVTDGVIENPLRCAFDPAVLACKNTAAVAGGAAGDVSCLTPEQIQSVRRMYQPVVHPGTKATVIGGLVPGAELGWGILASPRPLSFADEAFKYIVAKDPAWDASRFSPDTDLDAAVAADPGDVLSATNPDLRAFFARGGKLLLYHGWSDPQVTPLNTIDFFKKVVGLQGRGAVGTSIQLYMVPGMNHCQGGPGTDTFDEMAAVEQWMRTGLAPARIEASHATGGAVDRTRPLCPFGEVATWNRTGSVTASASFSCAVESGTPSSATR